jgi:hypothetical protein
LIGNLAGALKTVPRFIQVRQIGHFYKADPDYGGAGSRASRHHRHHRRFLATSVLVGYWVSHRASRDTKSYFLGGNVLPWYLLGVSNASGMFDIAGTMLLVTWLFVYGMKSVWIPWLWPVFNQIFLMVYLSGWLRRSGVTTGAEWIKFRFGNRAGPSFRI